MCRIYIVLLYSTVEIFRKVVVGRRWSVGKLKHDYRCAEFTLFCFIQRSKFWESRSRLQMVGRKLGWGGSHNTEDPYIVKMIGDKIFGLNLQEVIIGKVGLGRFHCTEYKSNIRLSFLKIYSHSFFQKSSNSLVIKTLSINLLILITSNMIRSG